MPENHMELQKIEQLILRTLLSQKSPQEVFEYFKKNQNIIAGIVVPKPDEKTYGAISKWADKLFFGGSLTYFAGMFTMLWCPPIGYLIGLGGVYGAYYGFKAIEDKSQRFEFTKAFYACLLAIRHADKHVSTEEGHQLEAFFSSFEFTPEEKAQIEALKERPVSSIPFPAWLKPDHKKSLLAGAWNMACCDGVTPPEEEVIAAIADKLGVSSADLQTIRADVERKLDEDEAMLIGIGQTLAYLLPEATPAEQQLAVDYLDKVNGKANSRERMIRGIPFAAPEAPKAGAFPDVSLAGGYSMARFLELKRPTVTNGAAQRLSALGKLWGLENDAKSYQEGIDSVIASFVK
jgi:uncharacterized tellurite resistance protein B-like protein